MLNLSSKKALLVSTAVFCASAHASEGPQFYGEIEMQALEQEAQDLGINTYRAQLGVKGAINISKYDIDRGYYRIEADLSESSDKKGDVEVLQAMMVVPSKYGTFLVGNMRSGQHMRLVGPVDVLHANTPNTYLNDSSLYRQVAYGSRVFAYVTPAYADTKLIVSAMTIDENNGDDADARTWRLDYNKDNIKASVGQVFVESSLWNGSADYVRTGLGISYNVNDWHLGFSYENNSDDPAGDSDVAGLATTYQFDSVELAVGYTHKNFKDPATEDDALLALAVTSDVSDHASVWVEVGKYEVEDKDNVSLGVKFTF